MSEAEKKSAVPTKAAFRRLAECKTLQEAFETRELRDRIAGAIPKHMDPDTLLRAFINASNNTPLIYKCRLRQSIGAFMTLSYLGLEPGTIMQHAHLIPFERTKWNKELKKRESQGYDLQVFIGYRGYVELAFRSGFVKDINAQLVYPGEAFDHEYGTTNFLKHSRSIDIDTANATPRGGYGIVSYINNGTVFEVMPYQEILRIRNMSQSYQTAIAARDHAMAQNWSRMPEAYTKAPWVAHEHEMARKTLVIRVCKLVPKSPELRAGLGLEEAQERGRVDLGPIIDGTVTPFDGVPEMADDAVDEAPPVESTPDPTSAHTDRRAQDKPQEPPKEPPPPEQPPAPEPPRPAAEAPQRRRRRTKAEMEAARAEKPVPSYVLRNAEGDRINTFTDPVKWAEAYLSMWQDLPSDEEADAFAAANEPTLGEVGAFPEAAKLFDNGDDDEQEAPAPELTPQQRKDRKWVSDRKADIAAIGNDVAGRRYFDLLVGNSAIRSTMTRLRTEEPELFAEIDAEFAKKNQSLPAAPQAGMAV
jgi:recombination protein RecT